MSEHYKFFQNTQCEFFPCHATGDVENFNCLFCYCPLYVLGEECGGKFTYMENGTKDCSGCLLPHKRDNYGLVNNKFMDIVKLMTRGTKNKKESPKKGAKGETKDKAEKQD